MRNPVGGAYGETLSSHMGQVAALADDGGRLCSSSSAGASAAG